MSYHLDFSKQAIEDIDFHKKAGNKAVLKKLLLLDGFAENPYTGTGKPEQLKYALAGYWSRRINHEYRLVYEVLEESVLVLSALGHYE